MVLDASLFNTYYYKYGLMVRKAVQGRSRALLNYLVKKLLKRGPPSTIVGQFTSVFYVCINYVSE